MTLSPNFTWYRCSDGKYMTVCALAANQWEHFCDAVERPDLKEAWATMRGNMYRGSELHEQIQKEVFDTNTREYWSAPASSAAPALWCCVSIGRPWRGVGVCRLEKLIANGGIPTAPVLSVAEVCEERQFWDNDYFVEIDYPGYEAHFGKKYRA